MKLAHKLDGLNFKSSLASTDASSCETESVRRKCTMEVLIHQSLAELTVFCCASTGVQRAVFRVRISLRA